LENKLIKFRGQSPYFRHRERNKLISKRFNEKNGRLKILDDGRAQRSGEQTAAFQPHSLEVLVKTEA